MAYLDLSRIQEGILDRDERFGYVILETDEGEGQEVWRNAHEFIQVWAADGDRRVEFLTRQHFHLATGEPTDPWG